MNLLLFGKFPPIQGGVSTSTYWAVRDLLTAGHSVDLVTNSNLAETNAVCVFSERDKERLAHPNLVIHQVDNVRPDAYRPWAEPYLATMIGKGVELCKERDFECIVGWYLQPYGLAASLVGATAKKPVLIRHAGSDVTTLAKYPDLRAAHHLALELCTKVIVTPSALRMLSEFDGLKSKVIPDRARRLAPEYRKANAVQKKEFDLDRFLSPYIEEASLWFADLGIKFDQPVRSDTRTDTLRALMFGKLGERKGSGVVLDALEKADFSGKEIHLTYLIAGGSDRVKSAWERVSNSDVLKSRVTLLPALPPWTVAELLCHMDIGIFLENDFPVSIHTPRVPREILSSGAHLICSRDIATSGVFDGNLVDGKNCSTISDFDCHKQMTKCLETLSANEVGMREMAAHGRFLSEAIEQRIPSFDGLLEYIANL